MENIYVQTLNEMYAIPTPQTGSVYFCEETHKDYVYNPKTSEWEELNSIDELDTQETTDSESGISLYRVNQMLIKQLPPMTKEQIADKGGKALEQFYCSVHNYYMLLCKDYNYYTVFVKNKTCTEPFVYAVLDIVQSLGNIHSIEINNDGVLEFWIAPFDDLSEEVYAFFLFPYDNGVVDFG